jgi:hypothetical protein
MTGGTIRMRIPCLIVLAAFVALASARAETQGRRQIVATNADMHYGEDLIVTGRVAQVTIRPRAVFINLEQPYPDSPFTGVIFSRFTNEFTNLPLLSNRNVEMAGVISNYQGKPEIILTNASQLTIGEVAIAASNPPPVPAAVEARASASPPAPALGKSPKPADRLSNLPPTILLWLVGLLAGVLALVLHLRKPARRSAARAATVLLAEPRPQTGAIPPSESAPYVRVETEGATRTQSQSWLPASAAAQKMVRTPESVREGVVANLSQWLKQHVVRRLLSDRAELLATQQAAALKMLAVDERLARIEQQMHQRNQDYERRIDELLKALITAEAENREMIRAQITFLKTEMEKARLKARQQSEEPQRY